MRASFGTKGSEMTREIGQGREVHTADCSETRVMRVSCGGETTRRVTCMDDELHAVDANADAVSNTGTDTMLCQT
eukprot:876046-Pleurochrysis_carterae.AAC.2